MARRCLSIQNWRKPLRFSSRSGALYLIFKKERKERKKKKDWSTTLGLVIQRVSFIRSLYTRDHALRDILCLNRRRSSNDLDRIYALMGLASEESRYLEIKYDRSVVDLSTDFAMDLLLLQ
jgi:hypothetical protein